MFKKIMVATDGSPASDKAVGVALKFKLLVPDTDVVVIHVSEAPPEVILDLGTERPQGLVVLPSSIKTNLYRERDEILERAKAMAEEMGVRVRFRRRSGDPASSIVQEAEKLGCDLIVVGGTGVGRLGTILGSVASKVASKFRGSVLIVR